MLIPCKEMTEDQRLSLAKYMESWYGNNFRITDDVVVVSHKSSKDFQALRRQSLGHETFDFFDGAHVNIKHEIAK